MTNKENTMKTVKTSVRDMIADLIADGSSIEEDEAQELSKTICLALCALLSQDKKWHEAHRGESNHGPAWEGGFSHGLQQAMILIGGYDE
jgi:hypothetical protein